MLGDGDEFARRNDLSVGLLHAKQTLVDFSLAGLGGHHRLQNEAHAVVVERLDDVIGDRPVTDADAFAAWQRFIEHEAIDPLRTRRIERAKSKIHSVLDRIRLVRNHDGADRNRRR